MLCGALGKRIPGKHGQVHWSIQYKYNTIGNGFNPFPNNPWFLCVCITSLLKTL